MDCCLWFNRCRISDASEIAENFDIAALRGYFLGGSLLEWLREHGGEAYADKLANIDPGSPDLDAQLSRAFGKSEPERREGFIGTPAAEHGAPNAGSFAGSGVMGSSYAADLLAALARVQGALAAISQALVIMGAFFREATPAEALAASENSGCGNGSGNGASAGASGALSGVGRLSSGRMCSALGLICSARSIEVLSAVHFRFSGRSAELMAAFSAGTA